MVATNETLKEYFRENFVFLSENDPSTIFKFLDAVINLSKEIHINYANDADVLSSLPLLAIISEIERSFPIPTNEYAVSSSVAAGALMILSTYSDEKRDFLKLYFLEN